MLVPAKITQIPRSPVTRTFPRSSHFLDDLAADAPEIVPSAAASKTLMYAAASRP